MSTKCLIEHSAMTAQKQKEEGKETLPHLQFSRLTVYRVIITAE
jgi:hypothetical protein